MASTCSLLHLRSTLVICDNSLAMASEKEKGIKAASWVYAFCSWVEALEAETQNPGGRPGLRG